ncbi:MAG: hypothetical protein HY884_00815 [Deltaproteobacteria bacterium]|nr:hypothetical protein [Deltaproteobacteria bacterium]
MAKSKSMAKIKKEDLAAVKRMTPSERLKLAIGLSGFSVKLMKAGAEAGKNAARKKS